MMSAMNGLFVVAKNLFSGVDRNSPEGDRQFRWYWPVVVLFVVVSAGRALTLGQDSTWDVLNYHFYSGFAFLHKPLNFDFAPAQVQSFFNPLLHVFSYLMLAHLPSMLVTVLLGAFQGLNIYLVFQISRTLFCNWTNPFRFWISFCNAATAFFGAIFVLELGTTFGDNLTSILILSGLLLIFRYLQSDANPNCAPVYLLGIAGFIIGVVVGLKLTVAIYAAAILIALPAVLLASDRRIRPLLVLGGFLGVGFIAVYGFWGYSLYQEYGNPVFPYMNIRSREQVFIIYSMA